jgi:ParB-like chromosome segregation protein Spo0J
MEALKSKEEINTYYVQTCRGDKDKLQADLEALTFPKLSVVAKALSMKVAGDKKSIVKILVDKIAKEDKSVKLKDIPVVEDSDVFQVKIDHSRLELVPRASESDYAILKDSIKRQGLKKKIEIEANGTIIDGHSRYQALQELGVFSVKDHTVVVDLPADAIEAYIFDMNFARRQLSDYHKIVWVRKYLPKIKIKVKAKGKEHLSRAMKGDKVEKKAKVSTRKEAAKLAGVSEAQQKKFNFLEKYAPDMLKDVEAEEMTLGGAYDKAYGWYKEIKAKDEDLFKEVEGGDISLEDAYGDLMSRPVEKTEEPRKVGPMETQAMAIRKMFEKCWKKEWGGSETGLGKVDSFRKEFLHKLDDLIAKNIDKGL